MSVAFASVALFAPLSYGDEISAKESTAKEPAAKGEKPGDDNGQPPIGLGGIELKEAEEDFNPKARRLVIPPYYQEIRGRLKLKFVFPLFFYRERTGEGARKDLGVLPFYWRYRSETESADVAFPLYWRFRGPGFKTDIVLQTHYNRSDHGYNFGFAPLVFVGKDTRDASSYQVIPPLFWRFEKGNTSFLLAGIYYDKRVGNDYTLGLPPLLFAGRERYKTYLVALPPLFWRFTDEINFETKNVLPPFFFNTREHGWSFGLMPLFYLARDKEWDRTLVAPFYYGSRWPQLDKNGEKIGEGKSYYIPLLLTYYRKASGLSQGGSAFFYHWYWRQGAYVRMFSPFVWLFGNERTGDKSLLIPPLFFDRKSPVTHDTMVGMLYWNFHEFHQKHTLAIMPLFAHSKTLYEPRWRTWIFPTFDFGKQPDGYHARLHPIFYLGKEKRKSHLVFAPLLWKFKDEKDDDLVLFPIWWDFNDLQHDDSSRVVFPFWWQFEDRRKLTFNRVAFPFYWDIHDKKAENRTVVVAPFFWRDRSKETTMTGFLNFVWHSGKIKGNPFWTFRLFPLLGFGQPPAPDGAYWSVLGGLVGWRRQGRTKQLRLFWLSFNVGD